MSRSGLFGLALTILAATTSAQSLLPSNLPACAQQCTTLQQGATGCLPSGGAPQTNQGTYQSCFCQSALLTQLYTDSPVQLCSSCQASDMLIIQNWYKNDCGKGGAPLAGGNQVSSSAAAGQAAATGTRAANSQPSSTSTRTPVANQGPPKSWIASHYQWIIMLIVVILGMGAFGYGFYTLHRRYHNKRIANWSTNPASQPDINTWTPGQSVHDLSWTARHGVEKSSPRSTLASIQPPPAIKEKTPGSPLRSFF